MKRSQALKMKLDALGASITPEYRAALEADITASKAVGN